MKDPTPLVPLDTASEASINQAFAHNQGQIAGLIRAIERDIPKLGLDANRKILVDVYGQLEPERAAIREALKHVDPSRYLIQE